jgi:hypothetical protein
MLKQKGKKRLLFSISGAHLGIEVARTLYPHKLKLISLWHANAPSAVGRGFGWDEVVQLRRKSRIQVGNQGRGA